MAQSFCGAYEFHIKLIFIITEKYCASVNTFHRKHRLIFSFCQKSENNKFDHISIEHRFSHKEKSCFYIYL